MPRSFTNADGRYVVLSVTTLTAGEFDASGITGRDHMPRCAGESSAAAVRPGVSWVPVPHQPGKPAIPWQVLVRAAAVVTGLVLLLFVDVHGVAFYIAWALILLALVSELAATLFFWFASR